MLERRLRDATLAAEKVVRDERLLLPIDLTALANSRDIMIEAKPLAAKGVSGMIIRVGDSFGIGYATHISSEGFQRFSVAHELGHFFLGHVDEMFRGGNHTHESRAGFGSRDDIELEADHFAAGLLMPSTQFKQEAGRHSDGLTAIEKVAERCKTSITSSAIRYAELTDAAVAIIVSSGASVDYCFTSSALRAIRGYRHPLKGSLIPKNSLTRDFNRTESNVLDAVRDDNDADLLEWFCAEEEIDATEEVIGLGAYGKTLTIITAEMLDEESERDDFDAPRFK